MERGGGAPPRGPVASGRAPDGGEGLLDGVLGALPVTEPAQREAEHRADVALVEELERLAVAGGGPDQQLGLPRVRRPACGRLVAWNGPQVGGLEGELHISPVLTHA